MCCGISCIKGCKHVARLVGTNCEYVAVQVGVR